MNSCLVLFVLWLTRFENANNSVGKFGWFFTSKTEIVQTWFSSNEDNSDLANRVRKQANIKFGETQYFTIQKNGCEKRKDLKLINTKKCLYENHSYNVCEETNTF